jgi:hypothetical protein
MHRHSDPRTVLQRIHGTISYIFDKGDEVAVQPDSHYYEVIPFLRITSSVTVGFPILLGELGRENALTALKSSVFS